MEEKPQMAVMETLSLLAEQRHDFLNHLQVLAGWLQLGDTQRALAYLRAIGAQYQELGQAIRDLPPEAALEHLRKRADAPPVQGSPPLRER